VADTISDQFSQCIPGPTDDAGDSGPGGQQIAARKRVGIFRRLMMMPRKHPPFERHSIMPGYVDQNSRISL
jgi:hypothetical protein